jgi:hypothetical protein
MDYDPYSHWLFSSIMFLIFKIVVGLLLFSIVGGLIVTLCIRKWGVYGKG